MTKAKAKRKRPDAQPHGRPTAYTPELGQRICELLAEGKTLTSICRRTRHFRPIAQSADGLSIPTMGFRRCTCARAN
jgi:hypothetical protein